MFPPLSESRRGNGAVLLLLVLGVGLGLVLMFGSFGGSKSYVQQVNQTRKKGRETANEISTNQLSILIAQYRQENNGKLPKTPADLDAGAAFNDQWGHQMTFSFETKNGNTLVKYHSNGPDGEPNNEDDVTRTEQLPF